ncbi:hypothetical protein [Geosporobacter ferrireducens]|uniref:Uncharacterized protein n=1 Tax=Geosporobacter ferrireducens TaxID=1424294 RepID=A0A1D8GLU8_9FIRM|nr:hypothetical protein [Geosporobacter ferrireducens]AOT71898.1 hypothetical protein Gferi_21590 [Geosporobacter ferrireducens]
MDTITGKLEIVFRTLFCFADKFKLFSKRLKWDYLYNRGGCSVKELLSKCRSITSEKILKSEIINTILISILGILFGVLSKLLDNMSLNNDILWQRILGIVDLANIFSRLSIWALFAVGIAVFSKRPFRASVNVFGFFIGMLMGYYTITITVSGFFPKTYMIAWSIITLFTPIFAFLTWYAKGHGWLAVTLSGIIIGFFFTQAFSFGVWYIDVSYFAEVLCLVIATVLLYRDKIQLLLSLIVALTIAPLIQFCLPYIFGGL